MAVAASFLLTLGLATAAGTAAPIHLTPVPTHGIIHFHEPKPGDLPPTDLTDPNVAGAEAICWWGDLEPEEGTYQWSRIDTALRNWNQAGKLLDIRIGTAHISPNNTPGWLFDTYHLRRIGRGHWCDVENGLGVYTLGPAGRCTTNTGEVITGMASIATIAGPRSSGLLLSMQDPAVFALNALHCLQFDFRSTTGATGSIALVNTQGTVLRQESFTAEPGRRSSFSFSFRSPSEPGARLLWALDRESQLSLDNVNLMPIIGTPSVQLDDLEEGPRDWTLTSFASLVRDRALALGGKVSLLLTNASAGYQAGIRNNRDVFPIYQGQGYSASYRYKAITDASIRLRLVSEATPFDVLDEQLITLKAGDAGLQKWHYPAFVWRPQTRLEIGLDGKGQVVVDDLSWSRWSDRVTCFPDYFDPVFRTKWQQFVKAFAARYARNPGVGRISVGGFGRWEEVILDDDAPGLLDAQWLARGFTTERYLEHIQWTMDLYQQLLPEKQLRVCLAYGLRKQNDQDLVYRRVAQAAVARGIGLKQNGLSEKYGAWDEITSVPYLFNRYRFRPDIDLTYETGGQISRVSPHYAQGHPLSVLNRTIIDGTDHLFLYGSDIHSRHVNKYLAYADDMFGAPLISTFYARLGDYSLVMDHSPSPQEYRNLWLGLREAVGGGATPILSVKRGERCAITAPGQPHIAFDIDDRQQYHGMHGVVFTVEYLDEGRDEFEVNCFNQLTAAWEKLGHVTKAGSGVWKTASFLKRDWCRSKRGDGEDVHADVVVNDLGDGVEAITGVELSFVPAREWKREILQVNEPGSSYLELTNRLARELEIQPGQSLDWVALPVWAEGPQRNGLTGRVIALTDSGEFLASEKNYPLPADRDWFEMPLTPVPGCLRYRVELIDPVGKVGWYKGTNGFPALRAWRYATTPGTVQSHTELIAQTPFVGMEVSIPASTTTSQTNFQLVRRLAGGSWSDPVAVVRAVSGQTLRINFEPQTAGIYQLRSDAPLPTSTRLLHLDRLLPANPSRTASPTARTPVFQPGQATIEPDGLVQQGGTPASFGVIRSRARLDISGAQSIQANHQDYFHMQLANRTGAPLLRLFWANPGQDFSNNRSVLLPLVQNDPNLRLYDFPIGVEAHWTGQVSRFRLELVGNDTSTGSLELGSIEISNGN
ncbi:MAG: hypothetical protein NTX27_22235 [Verrucomicrobia bacterium]|nr:hypothetical protein [Verrucomicrobiota bacterium]